MVQAIGGFRKWGTSEKPQLSARLFFAEEKCQIKCFMSTYSLFLFGHLAQKSTPNAVCIARADGSVFEDSSVKTTQIKEAAAALQREPPINFILVRIFVQI